MTSAEAAVLMLQMAKRAQEWPAGHGSCWLRNRDEHARFVRLSERETETPAGPGAAWQENGDPALLLAMASRISPAAALGRLRDALAAEGEGDYVRGLSGNADSPARAALARWLESSPALGEMLTGSEERRDG